MAGINRYSLPGEISTNYNRRENIKKIKEFCFDISTRYELNFIEIRTDADYIHLVYSDYFIIPFCDLPNLVTANYTTIIQAT